MLDEDHWKLDVGLIREYAAAAHDRTAQDGKFHEADLMLLLAAINGNLDRIATALEAQNHG